MYVRKLISNYPCDYDEGLRVTTNLFTIPGAQGDNGHEMAVGDFCRQTHIHRTTIIKGIKEKVIWGRFDGYQWWARLESLARYLVDKYRYTKGELTDNTGRWWQPYEIEVLRKTSLSNKELATMFNRSILSVKTMKSKIKTGRYEGTLPNI